MTKYKADEQAGPLSMSNNLSQDLAIQLDALTSEPHTSSECWMPARPMIIEAVEWISIAALIWVATLSVFS